MTDNWPSLSSLSASNVVPVKESTNYCSVFHLDIILLPWICDLFYLDIILWPWNDIFFLDIICYRDVTFSTSISFYHRNFRIGNHNLKIETERFTIPKTSEDLGICYHCNQNSVENELHILFHCDQYNDLRKTLLIKINDQNTSLQITFIAMIKSVFFLTILFTYLQASC